MTPSEAAELLTMCAAFDKRTIGRADVTAWHLAIGDLDYHDAQRAVAGHYGKTREWIMPSDIRGRVVEMREQRIKEAHAIYDGHPDETGQQSAQAIRTLTASAAAGHLDQRPVRAVLEAGRIQDPEITHQLAQQARNAIGRSIPRARAGVVNVLSIPCPVCYAPVGRTCRSRRKVRADAHPGRLEDAQRIASGLPPIDRAEADRERARRIEASRAVLAQLPPDAIIEPDDGFQQHGEAP